MSFADRIPDYRQRVESALERRLPTPSAYPERLHDALRYSVLGGGKRIRPLLVYATGELLNTPVERLDPIAVSIELIHAFSLVHDDLPAMDDDDLRRGRPTTHKVYDEATAILVGDALQSLAFYVLADDPNLATHDAASGKLVGMLAEACGSTGMTGGQAIDLAAEGRRLSETDLEDMYARKTGCLIQAAIMMPVCCSNEVTEQRREQLDAYSRRIGVAFQVRDDLLDVEGETEVIGKLNGSDYSKDKATYPLLFGADRARHRTEELYAQAMQNLAAIGPEAEPLRWLSDFIIQRNH